MGGLLQPYPDYPPDLLHAIRHMDTHQNQLLGAIATVFDDGEPYVQSLMADITADEVWAGIVGSDQSGTPLVPCPVRYSDRELQQQKEEFVKWERDIDLKQQVLKEVGAYTGWDGAVSPREYDEIRQRLETAKAGFLDREAKTADERQAWESVWPFQDDVI
jgi:mannitol/fructose-specific phosphotransferase system IIA component (Ntr-type)